MRETCKIFECKFQSLAWWVDRYEKQKDIKRKLRKNKNLKITLEIEQFVKTYVKKHSTATLWELSGLIDEKFKVKLSDMSVYSILNNLNISRKRVWSKYYPEKIEGQEQEDINEFYKKLEKYKKLSGCIKIIIYELYVTDWKATVYRFKNT
jgi:transposase